MDGLTGKKKRTWGTVLLMLAVLFAALFPWGRACAEEQDLQTIRVGYRDMPNLLTRNEDGEYSGILYDFMETIAAYAGVNIVYVPGTDGENYARLDSGEIDILPAVLAPAHGTSKYPLSSEPVFQTTIEAAFRDASTLDSGQQIKVGYFGPAFDPNAVTEWLNHQFSHYVPGYDLRRYTVPGTIDPDYDSGAIDAIITNSFHPQEGVQALIPLSYRNTYLAYAQTPRGQAVKAKFDQAMTDALLSDPLLREHILEKYSQVDARIDLTPEERAYIHSLGHLTAVSSEDQEPYSYFEDNEAKGVVAEIMQMISQEIGIPIESRNLGDNNALLQGFHNGEADIITDFNSDFNWAEDNEARITFPYIQIDYVTVMRRGAKVPDEPVVACVRGHYYTKQFVEKRYPEKQRIYFNTVHECMDAVSKGLADMTFAKAITVQHDIYNGNYYNLYTNGGVVFSHGVSIAVHKDADPRLLRILNKAIVQIDPKAVQGVVNQQFFSGKENHGLQEILLRNPVATLQFAALVVLALIALALLYVHYRRRHNQAMQTLAYTERTTGMHTLTWFITFGPRLIAQRRNEQMRGRLWLMLLTLQHVSLIKDSYNRDLLIPAVLKVRNRVRAAHRWMLEDAVNSELTRLYAFFVMPEDMTPQQAAELIQREAGSMEVGVSFTTNFEYNIGFFQVEPDTHVDGEVMDRYLACLQTALDEAVKNAKLCVVYNEKMRAALDRQREMEHWMHKALQEEEFQVWLQPKYNIGAQKIVGAEALVRWQSPELGFLTPGQFIEFFERNGFAVELDYYMLRKVLELQQFYADRGEELVPISVNQSSLHITEKGYLEKMKKIIGGYHLPPGSIELELTETAFIDFGTQGKRENAKHIIDGLHALGFSLAMDDFCTGYSSIAMLRNLPMDIMKIDRAMLIAAEEDVRSEGILRHVIALGRDLGMLVLCEGVETREQEELLLCNGCHYAQGFLFGKPMRIAAFSAILEKQRAED